MKTAEHVQTVTANTRVLASRATQELTVKQVSYHYCEFPFLKLS